MITEKTSIKTESVYSDDKKKRYSLSVEWNKQKKKAVVIMVGAGQANGIAFDNSTNLVLANLVRLGYGAVKIVNLFAAIGDGKAVIEKEDDEENITHIANAAASADVVIYAAGTGHMTNRCFRQRQEALLQKLSEYKDKLYCIADVCGRKFYHPLCPKVRKWNLVPFDISELTDDKAIQEVMI